MAAERQEGQPDQRRTDPEPPEPQRSQHVDDTERKPGQHRQPHAHAHLQVAKRGPGLPEALRLCAGRPLDRERGNDKDRAGHRRGRKCRACPHVTGHRTDHRAEQGATDRGAHSTADQLTAPARRGCVRQPGHARRPGAGTAETLDEPREVEDIGVRGPAERQRGHTHQHQAKEHDDSVAEARDQHAAGQRADQGAGRIGRYQDAGARLREPRRTRIVRQQWRQRCEEDRVDQDKRADEDQQHPDPGRQLRHSATVSHRYDTPADQPTCRAEWNQCRRATIQPRRNEDRGPHATAGQRSSGQVPADGVRPVRLSADRSDTPAADPGRPCPRDHAWHADERT